MENKTKKKNRNFLKRRTLYETESKDKYRPPPLDFEQIEPTILSSSQESPTSFLYLLSKGKISEYNPFPYQTESGHSFVAPVRKGIIRPRPSNLQISKKEKEKITDSLGSQANWFKEANEFHPGLTITESLGEDDATGTKGDSNTSSFKTQLEYGKSKSSDPINVISKASNLDVSAGSRKRDENASLESLGADMREETSRNVPEGNSMNRGKGDIDTEGKPYKQRNRKFSDQQRGGKDWTEYRQRFCSPKGGCDPTICNISAEFMPKRSPRRKKPVADAYTSEYQRSYSRSKVKEENKIISDSTRESFESPLQLQIKKEASERPAEFTTEYQQRFCSPNGGTDPMILVPKEAVHMPPKPFKVARPYTEYQMEYGRLSRIRRIMRKRSKRKGK